MEWGRDIQTGIDVGARQAVRVAMRYRCPCCGEPVVLRHGSERRPNFAHARNRAPADCENYHPAAGPAAGAPVDARHLGLYIQAEGGGVRPDWDMALLVPPPPAHVAASGEVRVPGLRGTHSIPVGDIRVPGRFVAVTPQGESYGVELSPEVDERYAALAGAGAPGLDARHPTVFHAGAVRGRRLEPGLPLWWGHSYFLVWPDTCGQHFPGPLGQRLLRPLGGWCCAEIELPPDEVPAVRDWAGRYLGRQVRAAPLVPVVIAPQPLFSPEGTAWVVPDRHELIIGAGMQRGARPPARVSIRRGDDPAEEHWLPGSLPFALSLGCPGPGQFEIRLLDTDAAPLIVEVVPWGRPGQPDGATLAFRDAAAEHRAPLYSEAAAEAVRAAFDGRCQITDIDLPPRAPTTLRHRGTPSAAWYPASLPAWGGAPSPGQADTCELLLRAIHVLIAERQGMALDLGAFGLLLAAPWDRALSGVRDSIALPADVRRRARWLRPLLGSSAATTACREVLWSLLGRVADGSATGADAQRLQRLCGQWSDPSPLEPHLRVFAAHLRGALSREA